MSQESGYTEPLNEQLVKSRRDIEKLYAIAGIIQTEADKNLKLQEQMLNIIGNVKAYKVAYATGTSGTIMTLFADHNKFINLVTIMLSATCSAASTMTLNFVDRGGTARTFCRRHISVASGTERFNDYIDFKGLPVRSMRGTGATFNVMPPSDVEVGDGASARFSVAVTGTGTFDATVVYYESEGASY